MLENSESNGIIRLDNKTVREWYINATAKIKDSIVPSFTFEEKAKHAFGVRNRMRVIAREMMEDKETKDELYKKHPCLTFEELVESKMKRKGMTRRSSSRCLRHGNQNKRKCQQRFRYRW